MRKTEPDDGEVTPRQAVDLLAQCSQDWGLWDLPHNGTPTSKAAAEAKGNAATERELVYRALAQAVEATREELETLTRLSGNSLRPRIYELVKAGRVEETGATRPTTSGRRAAILRVTPPL